MGESVYLRFDGDRTDKYGRLLGVSLPRARRAVCESRDRPPGLWICLYAVSIQAPGIVSGITNGKLRRAKKGLWESATAMRPEANRGVPSS